MKTFTLNGVIYKAVPFDFNMMCELEDAGLSLAEVAKKPMLMARLYVSKCINGTVDEAGELINQHVIGGGNLAEILEIVGSEITESDFFRALTEKSEEKTSKGAKKNQ